MGSVFMKQWRRPGSGRAVPLRSALLVQAGILLPAFIAAPVAAQIVPAGGTVVAGTASIASPAAGLLRIDQASSRAVIDWQSFSIGAGGQVHFENGGGATLNRVLGGDPSSLMGQLTATGSLWLVNPSGILVGPQGRVAAGGSFVASSRDTVPSAFMAGLASLEGSSAADVVNQGEIASGGDVVLVGHMVENRGGISAGGSATLVAADRIVLREAGADGRVHIEHMSGGSGNVSTSGRIEAAAAELRAVGGNVYALAADTSGLVRATGSRTEGGRILLTGGTGVAVSGTLDASGQQGGDIAITAPGIHLMESAELLATGSSDDGGSIRVGGERMGGPGLAPADRLLVSSGALLDASSAAARGGSVVLWSEHSTRFEGLIRADGPAGGGFAETSSRENLGIDNGRVEVGSGMWLLDPRNVTISTTGYNPGAPYPNPLIIAPPPGTGAYVINRAALQNALNAGASVTVTTTQPAQADVGNLTVSASINWSGAGSLTLLADNDITVNSAITTSGSGSLTLDATNNITIAATLTSSGSGTLRLEADLAIALRAVSLAYGGSLSAKAGTAITVDGAITSTATATGSVLLDAGTGIALNTAITLQGSTSFRAIGRGSGNAISFGGSGNRYFSTTAGAIVLEAPNAAGDILVGRNSSVVGNFRIGTTTGALSITAGRDILLVSSDFGSGRWTRVGDIGTSASVTLSAGRNITWDVGNHVDNFVELVSSGPVSVTAGSQINLQSSALSAARLQGRGASFALHAPTVLLYGTVEARGDTLLSGNNYVIGSVAPLFALDPYRSFNLDAASITSASALSITTSGTGDVRLGGSISGTSLLAVAGDQLSFARPISMSGSGNALVLVAGNSLVNNAGISPLSVPNGRWLAYSVSPFHDIGWQQLNPDQPNLYGRGYGYVPPVSPPGSGNRRIYSFTPLLTLAAGSGRKIYGQGNPGIGASVSGLVPGDNPADAFLGTPTAGSAGFAVTAGVGSYVVTPGGISLTAQGYALDPNPILGMLVVDPALLKVTADARTREYGLADPALTFSASGFVNDENASVLTGSLVRAAGEDVGRYAITQGSLAASNYVIGFTGADFRITPAALSIVADSLSRIYGDPDPSLTFTASGFRLGDTAAGLTGSLVRAAGEDVGRYAITQGSLAASANYALIFTGADFRITPAALSIVADSLSKVYGDPDPALTFTASGFRFADTPASVLSGALARAPGEDVEGGPYAITRGTLAASSNYVLAFQGAFLGITRRPLSIALAGNVARSYDATRLATLTPLNLALGGLLPGDSVGAQAAYAFYDTPDVGTGKLVSATGITLGGPAAGNYSVPETASAAIGTITPALLIARAPDVVRPFGVPNPPLPLKLTGLFGADTASSIGLEAVTVAVAISPPGEYPIDVVGSPLNYSVTRIPGTLTVRLTPAFLRVPPELIKIPALGGNTQFGVGVGVTALNDTLPAAPSTAAGVVFSGPRYSMAVEAAPSPPGQPVGSSAFHRARSGF